MPTLRFAARDAASGSFRLKLPFAFALGVVPATEVLGQSILDLRGAMRGAELCTERLDLAGGVAGEPLPSGPGHPSRAAGLSGGLALRPGRNELDRSRRAAGRDFLPPLRPAHRQAPRPGPEPTVEKTPKSGTKGPSRCTSHSYVPKRVLTLRAELAEHFPGIMKEDDGNLMEVALFEPLEEERTRVSAYGAGYRSTPEHRELQPAIVGWYETLRAHLER